MHAARHVDSQTRELTYPAGDTAQLEVGRLSVHGVVYAARVCIESLRISWLCRSRDIAVNGGDMRVASTKSFEPLLATRPCAGNHSRAELCGFTHAEL